MPQQTECDRCRCLRPVEQVGFTKFKCLVCGNEFSTISAKPLSFTKSASAKPQPAQIIEPSRLNQSIRRTWESTSSGTGDDYHMCPSCHSLRPVAYLSQTISRCLVCDCVFQPSSDDQQRKVLQELARAQDHQNESELGESSSTPTPQGGVYLIKSGPYFKIGKANDFQQRIDQLRIQLPERVVEIHRIYTDDPFGIENYWHKRFKDKRLNGEWFSLTEEDVEIFKARTQM